MPDDVSLFAARSSGGQRHCALDVKNVWNTSVGRVKASEWERRRIDASGGHLAHPLEVLEPLTEQGRRRAFSGRFVASG
jgi:hypothetical protein